MGSRLKMAFLMTIIGFFAIPSCDNSSGENIPESMEMRYAKIANGRPVTIKKTRAEFFDGQHTWTIFGASQFETEPVITFEKWSVGAAPFEVLIVKEPISDTPILPFSDPVPNASSMDSVKISAFRGEYEPASFVLRSGEKSLEHVQVEISDLSLIEGSGRISRDQVDVRLVKCWYQAGLNLRRSPQDKKRLTPELLLHDSDLVRVDFENHVNLVRDIATLKDAAVLLPFDVPARMNQQLWLTFQVPINCRPGRYSGEVRLGFSIGNQQMSYALPVLLDVDERIIADSPIEFSLYYLARLDPLTRGLGARAKNEKMLEAELRDMRAHGLTNVAVDYEYRKTIAGSPDFSRLTPVLVAMRRAGFETNRLLFVDWGVGGAKDSEEYMRKLTELRQVAKQYGFKEIFVYNKDERDLPELMSTRHTFEIAHQLGLKNFVACSFRTASRLDGLLDVAILPRKSQITSKFCEGETTAACIRITPWAYNDPQAGMETPGTYRRVYGASLIQDSYRGVCNYAYQSGDCWDDWFDTKWRPHVMAYPTFADPIPTLQWEGFRKAIDDIKKYNADNSGNNKKKKIK